ncbi:MAG: threonine synthase [Gammaproteobacteria bacterium]|nr:threonine synthase [Gammaproteobacteria bacterium]
MKFHSTRPGDTPVTLGEAITRGLAANGGLFVPSTWPQFNRSDFARVETLPEVARILLAPFFEGDSLQPHLPDICAESFSFPIPLRPVDGKGFSILELFHGPTAAFKDVGARFLAAVMHRLEHDNSDPLTILVATSGDTGGAVAAAFHGRSGIEVKVLYPAGMVSPRQEKQLTCWGGNVAAFRVDGAFDDCQALVKQAFAAGLDRRLSSANSINIGRLLPQSVYYAAASLWHWRETGQSASFIVPTGNLGNAVAAVWARHMGLPIERIVLATNANRVIPDFLATGDWQPVPSIATLASAMDVGDPSNMERLRDLYKEFATLRQHVDAYTVNDDCIRKQIVDDYRDYGELWCPHTATAVHVFDNETDVATDNMIVVATAHPAKFETVIEPLIDTAIEIPPALSRLLHLDSHLVSIPADFSSFARHL